MRRIYVFGSNLAGRHGAGSAKVAVDHWGAIYGQGEGLQGNSYALPTKNEHLESMSLFRIERHVLRFVTFAKAHPEMQFQLVAVGCGLAGYRYGDIGPLFWDIPPNVEPPPEFVYWIDKARRTRRLEKVKKRDGKKSPT